MQNLSGSLPFRGIVRLPDTLGNVQLFVEIMGTTTSKLEHVDKVFSNFVICAEAGMFSGGRLHPAESLLQVVSYESEANRSRWLCNVHGIDPGAFRILLGALTQNSRREPLEEVTLTGATAGSNDRGLEAVLACPFPGRMQKVPFELDLKAFGFGSTEPLIRMEFQRQLGDNEFDQIKLIIQAWDDIVRLGGYSNLSISNVHLLPELGDLYLAEPTVLEHPIYAFLGPEEMFNGVINMGIKIHNTISPLVALEIE